MAPFLLSCAAAVAGCGNKAAQSPNPTTYSWPERFAYHVDYVSEVQRDRIPLLHYAESKTTRFALRDAQYLGAQDSVLKTSQRPGGRLALVPYSPEDTLGFYVSIGRYGEITHVQLGCDPALAACGAALPSNVVMELRRIIPRLPVWPAPRGASWEDTLEFNETSHPGGKQSGMITRYTGRADTVISGRAYWVISWHSVRQALRPGSTDVAAEVPTQEDGVTYVEKGRLMPVFSAWSGAVTAPPELREVGATGTGYRGRAYLAGSVFDSLNTARPAGH